MLLQCSRPFKMNYILHFGQLISLVKNSKITVKMVLLTNSVPSGEATLWCPVWINHTIFGEKREVIIAVITRNIYLNLTQSVNGLLVPYTFQNTHSIQWIRNICICFLIARLARSDPINNFYELCSNFT